MDRWSSTTMITRVTTSGQTSTRDISGRISAFLVGKFRTDSNTRPEHANEWIQTLEHSIGLLAVMLYEESRSEKERATENAHKARHVQRVLQTEELDENVVATVRRHYQVARLQTRMMRTTE